MSDELILITPDVGISSVTATELARTRRDELVTASKAIVAINDEFEVSVATDTLKSLKTFADLIEAKRQAAAAPILATQRAINDLARDIAAIVKDEYGRLSRLLGTYELEQRKKREDAKRRADAEAARIAHENSTKALEIQRAARDPDFGTAPAEVEKKLEDLDRATTKAVVEVKQSAARVAPKATGTALRETPDFAVEDIKALYAAHPDYCTIEPNRRVILAILTANPEIKIPGVRHWREAKASIR